MGNQAPLAAQDNVIGENEQSRVYAYNPDTDEFLPLEIDSNGALAIYTPSGSEMATDLQKIGGQAQSAVDVADKIDQIEDALASVGGDQLQVNLENNNAGTLAVEQQTPVSVEDTNGTQIDPLTQAVFASVGGDELRVVSPSALDVSAAEVDVDLNSQSVGALDVSAATVPTEQQTPVGVEDSTGTQVDPDQSPEYPNAANQQDLIATGDLTVTVQVKRAQSLVITGNSTDSNTWSASVEWKDDSGNVVQTESATDIALSSVTDDWARLVRKGTQAVVTFTDTSGAGNNNVNTFLDTHR